MQPAKSPEPPKPSSARHHGTAARLRSAAGGGARARARRTSARREPAAPAAEAKKGPALQHPRRRRAAWRASPSSWAWSPCWAAAATTRRRCLRKPPPPKLGTLSLQTNPPGVAVFVDGVAHGNTPARISLATGSHTVELRGRGVPRVIPLHGDGRRGSVAVSRAARNAVDRQPAGAVGSARREGHGRRRRARRRARQRAGSARRAITRSCCRPRAVPR